jgi:hypothetical protein
MSPMSHQAPGAPAPARRRHLAHLLHRHLGHLGLGAGLLHHRGGLGRVSHPHTAVNALKRRGSVTFRRSDPVVKQENKELSPGTRTRTRRPAQPPYFSFFLGRMLGGVATGILPAVGGAGVQPGVVLPADHLVAVVLLGEQAEGGLDHPATQAQHLEVEEVEVVEEVVSRSATV